MSFSFSSSYRQSHRRSSGGSFSSSTFLNRISPRSGPHTCPICLATIRTSRLAILSPCSHAYCVDCILTWSGVKRTCPLCNSIFDSWLHRFDFQRRTFDRYKPSPIRLKSDGFGHGFRRPVRRVYGFGLTRRTEESRSRPLPTQRSFRPSASDDADQVAERVLEWRASVYKEKLRAVPLRSCTSMSTSCPTQRVLVLRSSGDRIGRVSPWIRRELQAVLDDPDPTIIVHVVTSLYASSLRENFCDSDFLAPLRVFLHDWTDMFWHELRCFAESSLTLETYDTVVNYERIGR